MALSPISSPGGARDIMVDLSDTLESAESLATAVLQSTLTGVSVTTPVVLAANATVDGTTVAAGKGFSVSISTTAAAKRIVTATFLCTGDSGTAERVDVRIPVVPTL